ncbi:DUF4209 domain-containing protein [Clostridium sp. MSJ-8]|uniref:DUF4209 domain-containing protein n=1 Tax=Clostridium sp. MSJ-8 TaxID=2841510 RepID=UPI001C0EC456|nr:DUF4209 domain-containing protein [Clostridium sp. MSJ-8]MBU5488604.1 DUF4209 domain-containing protein [Clostridium sp. MSJ-8]
MISDLLVNNIKPILNDSEVRKDKLGIEIEKDIYSEDEKKLICYLIDIDDKFFNYSYNENPYSFLNNRIAEKSDIESIVTLIEDNELKAKIYDSLWVNYKNYEGAQEAYRIFIKLINKVEVNSDDKFHYILRIFDIYVTTGKREEKLREIKEIVDNYIHSNMNDKTAKSLILLEMFVKEKTNNTDFLIKLANEKIEVFEDEENPHIVEGYYDLIEDILCQKYKARKNQKSTNIDIVNIRRKKVEYLLRIIRNGNLRLKVNNYMKVIKILKTIPDTEDERREIVKEMEPYQKETLQYMQKFSYSKDTSEEVNKIIKSLEGKDLRDVFTFYVTQLPFVSKEEAKKAVLERSENSLTALLFPTVVLDKRGKIKYKLPSISAQCKEEAISANTEAEYLNYASLYTQVYVNPILLYIHKNFKVDEELLEKIVEDNFFVPGDRKKSFVKGLLAGFEFDLITALSILVPQVENALRCLAEECGDVIYKSNEDGVEELITLNGILDLPKLNETLDDNLIFNLKSIFTSKFGINIRNEVAHGIIDDEEFKSVYSLYVWWFILKLCCICSPWIMFREK